MKLFISLIFAMLLTTSCARKDNDTPVRTSPGGTIAAGSPGISASLNIKPNCQASSATVQLSQSYGGGASDVRNNVANGSRVSFQIAQGSYTILATAGVCSVSGTVDSVVPPLDYQICLGQDCNLYKTMQKVAAINLDDAAPCTWGTRGCKSMNYTGTGGAIAKNAQIHFSTAKETALQFKIEYVAGNNLTSASPSFGNLKVLPQGQIISENIQHETFVHEVQLNENLLQGSDGFCGTKENIVNMMKDYLATQGFSLHAQAAFQRFWSPRLPNFKNLCAYPQGKEVLQKVANYKSSENLSSLRLWFALLGQEQSYAQFKLLKKGQPKNNALLVAQKSPAKTRNIAANNDVNTEETGLVFLLEK
jgi:hypothetical protein